MEQREKKVLVIGVIGADVHAVGNKIIEYRKTVGLFLTIEQIKETDILYPNNRIVCVNYSAFNLKNEKKVNFAREENVDEI